MFCINYGICEKAGANGNCTIYNAAGVVSINQGRRTCAFVFGKLPENKVMSVTKKVNALKASKRASAGK